MRAPLPDKLCLDEVFLDAHGSSCRRGCRTSRRKLSCSRFSSTPMLQNQIRGPSAFSTRNRRTLLDRICKERTLTSCTGHTPTWHVYPSCSSCRCRSACTRRRWRTMTRTEWRWLPPGEGCRGEHASGTGRGCIRSNSRLLAGSPCSEFL